jgi:adenylate cyclase
VLAARLKKDATDGPTAALLDRCLKYAAAPPPARWDGVTNLDK